MWGKIIPHFISTDTLKPHNGMWENGPSLRAQLGSQHKEILQWDARGHIWDEKGDSQDGVWQRGLFRAQNSKDEDFKRAASCSNGN